MRRLLAVLCLALLGLVLPACGAGTAGLDVRSTTAPNASAQPGEQIRLTCGLDPALDFSPAALDGPENAEQGTDAAAQALREWSKAPPEGMPAHETGWSVLTRTADQVLYAHGEGLQYVVFTRTGELWKWSGSGSACSTRVAVPDGFGSAGWSPADPVPPDATSFTALVGELACTSGESAEGRIDPPRVDYRADAVVVAFQVRRIVPTPPVSGFTCQGNPPTPYDVTLREPLGDRPLLDGAVYPPAPMARPSP